MSDSFVTLWIIARQAPLSMGLPRQEYRRGLPCPLPGDLPDPQIESMSLWFLLWKAGSLPLAPPDEYKVHDIKGAVLIWVTE